MGVRKRIISLGTAVLLALLCTLPAHAAWDRDVTDIVADTAAYLVTQVPSPQVSSVGGEWSVIGLARAEAQVPDGYFEGYCQNLENYLRQQDGVLHERKYTEYSRVVLALTAIGEDPRDVAGYDVLAPLGDFEKVVWQGINGPIFALLALDSGNYEVPVCEGAAVQATRELYIEYILERQLADGGFSLTGDASDPDITGMVLQAFAKYQDRPDVAAATEQALSCLSALQNDQGGYGSWGVDNLESSAQVLNALCELNIDPTADSRFIKNGNTVLDDLLRYYEPGAGFRHASEGQSSSGMSTEQGLYTLANYQRRQAGKDSLYTMQAGEHVSQLPPTPTEEPAGLPGKLEEIQALPVTQPGKTFGDIAGHPNQAAIEALASRGMISGQTEDSFAPDATMTRAEFAAIITRGLGLVPAAADVFSDVAADAWYAGYVGTAYTYGIIKGVTETRFAPEATITREEAAVMTARVAGLCGLETAMGETAVRDVLSQFPDYTGCAAWASEALAFCYQYDILSQADSEIRPQDAILRCEVAQMLYGLLDCAELL